MSSIKRGIVAGIVAALLMACGTIPASAASTFTQRSFSVTVNADGSVTGRATVSANPAVTANTYGIWARNTAGNKPGIAYRTNIRITTTGTAITGTNRYAPGTYTAGVYVVAEGRTTTVGPTKTFTVPPALLFEDNFTGPAGPYNHNKWGEWSTATYNGSAAYGSIQPGDRATLNGAGQLSIPATPTQGTAISTAGKFDFVYGTITVRAKAPTTPGYWPAIWTLNNNPNGQDVLPIGEIDLHESYTGLANYAHIATHHWNGAQTWHGGQDPAVGRDHIFGEWHDYSAKVEPGRISFYFDGAMVGTYATKEEGAGKPYAFGPDVTRGNWLILSLAIGGAGGQQDGMAVSPATFLVDRVEVRAL